MKLASFDIFDTVLIRECGRADNVFWLLARNIYPDDGIKQVEFAKWRIDRNHDTTLDKNYTIEDVYDTPYIEGFGEYSVDELINRELDIESNQLTKNEHVIPILRSYREQGYHIAFISDMYLPEEFVHTILKREHVLEEGDDLFVSNKHRRRKDDGSLFDWVKGKLNPSEWIHNGDNGCSDVDVPKSKGIKTHLLKTPFSGIEQKSNDISSLLRASYEMSVLAGIQRCFRTKYGDIPSAVMAVDYIAPAYVSYVIHILADAKKKGLHRLYFLSRDSYILQQIAESLPHEGVEFRYLFVSRASLMLPFLYQADKQVFRSIFINDLIEVRKLLKQIGLSFDYLNEKGYTIDFPIADTEEKKEKVLSIVFQPEIYEYWQKKAKMRYLPCVEYLKHVGIMDSEPFALVDVGWLGTSRMMINALRKRYDAKLQPCLSYYWSTISGVLSSVYGPYDVFINDIHIDQTLCWYIEDYFSLCPYPTTVGYKIESSEAKPVLKEVDTSGIKPIVDYNARILTGMASEIVQQGISEDTLYTWAAMAANALRDNTYKIDYAPFSNICADNTPLIKKLSKREYFHMAWDGTSYTKNDYGSMCYTFGYEKGHILWALHFRILNWKKRIRNMGITRCLFDNKIAIK